MKQFGNSFEGDAMMTFILSISTLVALWISMPSNHNPGEVRAAEPKLLPFLVKADVALQELSPEFCWFYSRTAAIQFTI